MRILEIITKGATYEILRYSTCFGDSYVATKDSVPYAVENNWHDAFMRIANDK